LSALGAPKPLLRVVVDRAEPLVGHAVDLLTARRTTPASVPAVRSQTAKAEPDRIETAAHAAGPLMRQRLPAEVHVDRLVAWLINSACEAFSDLSLLIELQRPLIDLQRACRELEPEQKESSRERLQERRADVVLGFQTGGVIALESPCASNGGKTATNTAKSAMTPSATSMARETRDPEIRLACRLTDAASRR